jgi:hypothetical protein
MDLETKTTEVGVLIKGISEENIDQGLEEEFLLALTLDTRDKILALTLDTRDKIKEITTGIDLEKEDSLFMSNRMEMEVLIEDQGVQIGHHQESPTDNINITHTEIEIPTGINNQEAIPETRDHFIPTEMMGTGIETIAGTEIEVNIIRLEGSEIIKNGTKIQMVDETGITSEIIGEIPETGIKPLDQEIQHVSNVDHMIIG